MKWNEISQIQTFTSLEEIFQKYGKPQFKMKNSPKYYMGNGFFISYTNKQFYMEKNYRKEYGDDGEFVVSISYFDSYKDAEKNIKRLKEYKTFFDDNEFKNNFEIVDGIWLGMQYQEVLNILNLHKNERTLLSGEDRGLDENKKFVFIYNWIGWGGYQFFFFEKTKKAQLKGFEYNLPLPQTRPF